MVGKTKEVSKGIGTVPPVCGKVADGGKGFLMAEQGLKPEDATVSDGAQRCPGHDGSLHSCQHGICET